MTESASDRDPIEELAESFVQRYRQGDRPVITEYVDRHPDLADQIRELFPALLLMEEVATDESASARPPVEGVPGQLGDYRILQEVGRGGMGIVYEAVQESLGRHVALKVLPAYSLMDSSALDRFQREARAAARLHHTNIVPVFGVGQQDGIYYYAMQFIEGHGLDDVLLELRRMRRAKRSLPAGEDPGATADTLASGSKVSCTGLAESLLIGGAQPTTPGAVGSPKDDDLDAPDSPARAARPDHAKSVEADVSGVSPDRTGGFSSHKDALSEHPSKRPGSTLGSDSRHHYFRNVARIGLQVAEALAYAHGQGIVHRDVKPSNLLLDRRGTIWVTDFGLAKDAAQDHLTHTGDVVGTLRYMGPERFHGACDARSDTYSLGLTLYELTTLAPAFDESDRGRLLRQVVHAEPRRPRKLDRHIPRDLETVILKSITKEPNRRYQSSEELAEDLRRFLADRPVSARRAGVPERAIRWCRRNPVVALLMTTVVVSLLAGILISSHFAVRSRTHALDATEKLWDAYLAQAQARRLSGRVGQRFESLEAIRAAAKIRPAPELRDEAIACMGLFDLRLESRRTLGSAQRVAFGPKLERYAEVDDRRLTIRRIADAREVLGVSGPGHWWGAPRFSADGRLLAQMFLTGNAAECQVWDIDRGELTLKIPVSRSAQLAAFCPDRRSIAVFGPDGNIQRYDLETGELLQSASTPGNPGRLLPHRDGRRFAVIEQLPIGRQTPTTVHILDLYEGDVVQSFTHPGGALTVSWHPDGKHVAVLCQDFTVRLWDAESGQPRSVLRGHQADVVGLVFQPGRNLLATTSWDGTVRIWNPLRGNQLLWAFEAFPIRFSADGRRFCSCRPGVARIWEVADPACRTLHEFSEAYKGPWYVDFSPDGRLLASAGDDGVRLWHVPTGREVVFLPVGQCLTAVFSSSGHHLLASGAFGVQQWPIVADGQANILRIGPPETIVGPTETGLPRLSLRGDRFVRIMTPGNFAAGSLNRLADLTYFSHRNVAFVDLSPDAKWIATGTWGGTGIRVWDARHGTLVKELVPESHRTQVGFSPDGRWLVAGTEREYRFWEVGSWKAGHRIAREPTDLPGPVAFTRDGRMLATALTRYVVQLTDAVSGEKLAKFEAPDPLHVSWLCFSPDGSQLAVASESHAIQIWDLRSIREGLERMGLDWELPPYPSATPDKSPLPPTVHAVMEKLKAPSDHRVMLFRNGDWRAALAAFEQSMRQRSGGDGRDWFYLAMIHWKLENHKESYYWFRRAEDWKNAKTPRDLDVRRLNDEAATLLGVGR